MKNNYKTLLILLLITGVSQAVQLSQDGTGEVLIFPYYTVNGGINTLITLTNTKNEAKALRVRFREAANSREVFTFNLYLGARDMWVGALVKSYNEGNELTRIISPDSSCIYPEIQSGFPGNESSLFYNYKYTGALADPYGEEFSRMHEGFIEVIEMGVLTGASADAVIIDQDSNMANCTKLVNAWDENSDNPYWLNDATIDMQKPTGGIAGEVVLIHVDDGIAMSQSATAIEKFGNQVLHYDITSDSPSLADGTFANAIIENENGMTANVLAFASSIDAVTAVLMKTSIYNEYVVNDSIGAETDWIITMPTRQYHVDPVYNGLGNLTLKPFTQSETPEYCEAFETSLYNRDAASLRSGPIGLPPPFLNGFLGFCYATNNLNINKSDDLSDTDIGIFSSNFPMSYVVDGQIHASYIPSNANTSGDYFDSGWVKLYFEQDVSYFNLSSTEVVVKGLPVIGFAAHKFVNGNLENSTLANYAGLFEHKSNTIFESDNLLTGMKVADDNIGQALIFPYYTVRNELNTLITVTNTTDEVKALKVRFLEGKNNRECLSFNLYLSANDVWTSALTKTLSTQLGFQDQESVKLITHDSSCVSPNNISEQEFLPDYFIGEFNDGLGEDLVRCTEGHIQIIEMGTVVGTDAQAVTHSDAGIPENCGQVDENWAQSGQWSQNPTQNLVQPTGTGGIYGSVHLINVPDGVDYSYDATAIVNFNHEIIHSSPGSQGTNLSSGSVSSTVVNTATLGLDLVSWNSSIDAVSSLFMQNQVSNHFVISAVVGARTAWINTFPSKQYYTDPLYSKSQEPLQPFNSIITEDHACDRFEFRAYSREQAVNYGTGIVVDPVPPHLSGLPQDCWAVNVINVSNNIAQSENIFDSKLGILEAINGVYTRSNDLPFDSGLIVKDYTDIYLNTQSMLTGVNTQGVVYEVHGKPVIGFLAQKYAHNFLNGNNTLSNYAVTNKNINLKKIIILE